MLTSRELASAVWICLLAIGLTVVIARKSDVRSSVVALLGSLANPKIVGPLLGFYCYIAGCAWLANTLGLWDRSLLKEMIVWTAVSGFAVMFASTTADDDPKFFRKTFVAVFGINIAIEFIFGLASFPFWIEFILQPILTMLILLELVAKQDPKAAPVAQVLEWVLAILGLVFILGTLYQVGTHINEFDSTQQFRTFAMLIWLPIASMPFIYGLSWAMSFEQIAGQLRWRLGDRGVPVWMKAAVMIGFNRHLHHLGRFRGDGPRAVSESASFKEALTAVGTARDHLQGQERARTEAVARLERFAGAKGNDEEGRRLDRREFTETRSALQWLATCHVGWYQRDDGGRYRRDLLDILGDLSNGGLPEPQGIQMRVSKSAQSWYAWRRTVSGWVFAIGASEEPPNEWLYDGPEPPRGFPGHDRAWGDNRFNTPLNWTDECSARDGLGAEVADNSAQECAGQKPSRR